MGLVKVHADFREVRGKLLQVRDELDKSCNDPGVKESIYSQVYLSGIPNEGIPYDTGALALSPLQDFTPTPMGKNRFANGGINSEGIVYDPLSYKGDQVEHYASKIMEERGWNPAQNVRNDVAQGYGNSVVLEIVKQSLMESLK